VHRQANSIRKNVKKWEVQKNKRREEKKKQMKKKTWYTGDNKKRIKNEEPRT